MFDLVVFRFISIICTGLAIGQLNAFKEEHLGQNDDFTKAVEEIIDKAVAAITLTLVTQIFGLLTTLWWTYVVFSPEVKYEEPKVELNNV